jgi:hypothetical protein
MIIDSHLHLPVDYPDFPAKGAALIKELRRNGVDMGIVIADSYLESVIGSVRDCAELFRDSDIIKVIAGISPFISFDTQLVLCKKLLESGDIIGLKLYTGHESFFCTDEVLSPVYDLAAEFKVPVLFHTGWDNPQYAAPEKMKELAQCRTKNIFVYCHCLYPNLQQCFDTLGSCGNVYFDTSSIADDAEVLPQIKNTLEPAIASMPERIIFGSDFGSCSQKAHLEFAESLDITPQQRELLMCGNALRVYNISP